MDVLAPAVGLSPDALREEMHRHHQKRLARIRANNARYDDALRHLTPKQTDIIAKREADGWKMGKIWPNRISLRAAVMLSKKPVWDSSKNRMGAKLAIVYPDGTVSETFERSISLRSNF